MKTLLTFVLTLFSFGFINAQDLLLSEDFDYPIGNNLNQHGWKPLTSATDNPIKIVKGISVPNYQSVGNAAYLDKTGQDVFHSFDKVSNGRIFVSFQLNTLKVTGGDYLNSNKSNYFLFLSSKEDPTKPLLRFSLAGGSFYYAIFVYDADNNLIAYQSFHEIGTVYNLRFSLDLSGNDKGLFYFGSSYGEGSSFSKVGIKNLANIVLSQSDKNIGSVVVVDRIRVGKTFASVEPCIDEFKGNFIPYIWKLKNGSASSIKTPHLNTNIVLENCENKPALLTGDGVFRFQTTAAITPVEIKVPHGFKVVVYNNNEPKSERISPTNTITKSFEFPKSSNGNLVEIFLVGDSKETDKNGIPISGKAGIYEGKITIEPNGGYCVPQVWNIRGEIKGCNQSIGNSVFNLNLFPNISGGEINLLINDKTPEEEIEVKLTDNQGVLLFQEKENWKIIKPKVEEILKKSSEKQFYFSVKQGENSKTIRVFQEK